jgi:phosphoribosyl 1,2-cyclic phosphate phosphodiesterase
VTLGTEDNREEGLKMKIKYLGTAAAEGWPALFCECQSCKKARELGKRNIRTRSQAIIDETLLVDFPPDAYMHVLSEGLQLSSVKTLLITHSHQDHFYPLDLILRGKPYAHSPITKVLDIYGNDAVKLLYERALKEENNSSNLTEIEQFHEIHTMEEFSTTDSYHITALAAAHKENENCLLYLIEKEGKCMFYANDSGWYPEKTWEKLKDKHIDLVSMDCTNGNGYCERYHMGIDNNRQVKERMLQIGCADEKTKFVITHFSHNANLTQEDLELEVDKDGFLVAYDGFELEI